MKKLSNNQILMKEIIEGEFNEQEEYQEKNSFFEFFSASQILKNNDLSDSEIASCIVGGGNDGGCDGLFLFLNNELLTLDQVDGISGLKGAELNLTILQSKNTTGFNEDAIMKWKTVSSNLLDMTKETDEFSNRYTEQVVETFSAFKEVVKKLIRYQPRISFDYYYVSLGIEVHDNVKAQSVELKELVNTYFPSATVEVHFVTADKLMDMYNASIETVANLEFAENPISRGKNTEFVSLINLAKYYYFITDDDGKLRTDYFEANVRDYQGGNSVNSCISESLASDSTEDFWWLNNGITILTDSIVSITQREIQVKNPEIVNGLQTSTEIYNYYSSNESLLESENRNVLVRVIVPASEETRDAIIFATNNQTSIPKSSLRVTDPIHYQIEMYLKNRGLYYDRRKNYYKNQKKKSTEIVAVSFLAQCLISIILRKPDYARARPSTLLTDDETYDKLYGKNANLETYYKATVLGKKVQLNLMRTSDITSSERNDVLFYLLYAVAAKIYEKQNISFDELKDLDLEKVTDKLIDELKKPVFAKYKELGGNGRVAKSESFILEIDRILGFEA